MKNFVHGCHLITVKKEVSVDGFELWQCIHSDQSPWRKDGNSLLFTSLFRADQYLRQTEPARKEYLQTKIPMTEIAKKFTSQIIMVNPCAFCDHHTAHKVMDQNISLVLQTELQKAHDQAEIYLTDAKQAMEKKKTASAIEILLVIVEHLAPDLIEAHALLEKCAVEIKDSALLKTAQTNLAALS